MKSRTYPPEELSVSVRWYFVLSVNFADQRTKPSPSGYVIRAPYTLHLQRNNEKRYANLGKHYAKFKNSLSKNLPKSFFYFIFPLILNKFILYKYFK